MVKEIRKIGNSHGIILDNALLSAANLKEGDKVSVAIHGNGALSLTPLQDISDEEFDQTLESVLEDYTETLSKLA